MLNRNDSKQVPPDVAFFVTWRIPHKQRKKDFVAIFESHKDAATFIVKNKKSKPDMQVYMAIKGPNK